MEDHPLRKLLGSWNVAATTPTQGAFPALITFTAEGSVIASEPPGPFESAGHGSWAATENGEVAYTFLAFLGSQESKNTGTLKVSGRMQLDASGDSWHGPFKIDVIDANGRPTFTDRGTFQLTRIPVELLQ